MSQIDLISSLVAKQSNTIYKVCCSSITVGSHEVLTFAGWSHHRRPQAEAGVSRHIDKKGGAHEIMWRGSCGQNLGQQCHQLRPPCSKLGPRPFAASLSPTGPLGFT